MTTRAARFGRLLATLGVLLLAIKIGLQMTDTAGGGSPLLMFASVGFILLGVALIFRQRPARRE